MKKVKKIKLACICFAKDHWLVIEKDEDAVLWFFVNWKTKKRRFSQEILIGKDGIKKLKELLK